MKTPRVIFKMNGRVVMSLEAHQLLGSEFLHGRATTYPLPGSVLELQVVDEKETRNWVFDMPDRIEEDDSEWQE